jgi:hypothetical protein
MKINYDDHHLPLYWLCIMYCIILVRRYEHNTLASKKVDLIFLPCEACSFCSASPVLITHVIKFWINSLINPPGRRLTLNVCDVICIWVRDRDIINPIRRGARTINRNICRTWGNSWRCWGVVVSILGTVCELVSREVRERLFMASVCGQWGSTTTMSSLSLPLSLSVLELLSLDSS